jgi:NADH dehydrogenase [ubiquinone] 1 alpha subcomplex assembly factor 7
MKKIINILKKKPIPLDQFINLSLYGKKFGYYMKKNPFGKKGDFITSPLVSRLFSEMIAIWCVSFWEHLGKPKKIFLVELGPGDASLCNDLMDAFKNFKNFYNSLEMKLLEKSTKLKKIQRLKIKNKKVKWIKNINQLKSGPIIFLGNEFFDSLPIKQIYIKKKEVYEKYVAINKSNKKIKFIYKKAKKNLINDVENLGLTSNNSFFEYPVESIKYLNLLAKIIKKYNGGLLTFDYGYTRKKNFDSLQSVKKHKYLDVLSNPSNADITSHINFSLFSTILKNSNLDVKKIVTQNEFLKKLGIIERANMLARAKSFNEKADIFYRLKKLLDYKEMGYLFKVLFAQKKNKKFFLGF